MRTLTALLIEDHPPDAHTIERILKRERSVAYRVLHEETLREGLARIESSGAIDIILLDLSLPDGYGLESVSKMARHAPDVPLIILTGLNDEQLAIDAVQSGAEDYLVKGDFDGRLLSRAIRYAIERKRSKIALRRANVELEARVEERTAELKQVQEAARQQQEELAHVARLHSLGEMATGLAHELNQPLMAIVCFCSSALQRLAAGSATDEQIESLLNDISLEATRSGEIINRLRRMVGKRTPQRAAVDINNIVQETVAFLDHQFQTNDVTVSLELMHALPIISADRIQIQQVMVNLLTNAIQAIVQCAPTVREICVLTSRSRQDNFVHVDVINRGPVMAIDEQERLFDPFYTTKHDGLGLGLSISRTIVESHDGKLVVLANESRGTAFRVSLPYE